MTATTAPLLVVDAAMLEAMEACLAAVDDMTALSRRVFATFLAAYPDEAARFLNLDAAVLRMTDESFVLLHGLASGAGWAAVSIAHMVDLHRSYGAIGTDLYAAWTAYCLDALAAVNADLWQAGEPGWRSAEVHLNRLIAAANRAD